MTLPLREEIIMLCTADLAGQVRGKGFPASDLDNRIHKGIGWTPTNSMITAHGPIAPSPWGAYGDTVLQPDPSTRVRVEFGPQSAALHYMLGDIRDLDGSPWPACPRGFLKRMLDILDRQHGLQIKAAFEHEFVLECVEERPNSSYALDAFGRQGLFAETCLGALQAADIAIDTFMPEYGPSQYEVTVEPAVGVQAADQAVAVREIIRAVARYLDTRASFTPILRSDAVGNGVHMHFSLLESGSGTPVNHDATKQHSLSATASAFLAGVLQLMPQIIAVTAASSVSYLRLTPNRWSAAYNNLGVQDREAGLRICPVFAGAGTEIAQQFHFEYRAADASATPHLVLGAIVAAGLYGLEKSLQAPEVCTRPPQDLDERERERLAIVRLPQTLGDALDLFEQSSTLTSSFGEELAAAYLAHKRFEVQMMHGLSLEEQCQKYRIAY